MKRMATSNVLIVGLRGLGVEIGTLPWPYVYPPLSDTPIAKNLCLAGVKTVAIYDPEPVTVQDLGTQVRRPTDVVRALYSLNYLQVFPSKS